MNKNLWGHGAPAPCTYRAGYSPARTAFLDGEPTSHFDGSTLVSSLVKHGRRNRNEECFPRNASAAPRNAFDSHAERTTGSAAARTLSEPRASDQKKGFCQNLPLPLLFAGPCPSSSNIVPRPYLAFRILARLKLVVVEILTEPMSPWDMDVVDSDVRNDSPSPHKASIASHAIAATGPCTLYGICALPCIGTSCHFQCCFAASFVRRTWMCSNSNRPLSPSPRADSSIWAVIVLFSGIKNPVPTHNHFAHHRSQTQTSSPL